MASKKEQTTQTAVAVATKEATDSDASAAETAQETPNAAGEEKTAEVQEVKDTQAEVRQEPHMPAGTRAAAQRSEAFAAPNASDSECRAGRATEEYPLLEDVAVLAILHRVAAFEQAALMRMMGWADGKMIADADYRAALAKLHGRRLGGGRMV